MRLSTSVIKNHDIGVILSLLPLALALAGPVLGATPLKWPPPPMVNPVSVVVSDGDFSHWCQHNEDVRLIWPPTKHIGKVTIAACHNIVSIGGWTTVSQGPDLSNTSEAYSLYLKDDTGVAHIEGLLIDASAGGMSDGIDISAPAATVQVENVRIEGIFGYSDQFHADCIQPFGGVAALRVDHLTCNTGYQGLSLGPAPGGPAGAEIELENVNIASIGAPIHGLHNNGGYIYWPQNGALGSGVVSTQLRNVYLQPRAGVPFAQTVFGTGPGQTPVAPKVVPSFPPTIAFVGLPISGFVAQGPPPGGDFVPAGIAGPHYVSPGYTAAP